MKIENLYNLLFLLLITGFSACNDQWDDHNKLSGEIEDGSLLDQINNTSELTTFAGYLVQTGYDKVLKADLNCTVWAPTNDAFAGVDASVLSDSAQLRTLIGNHIGYELHMAQSIGTPVSVEAINGKLLNWVPQSLTIENAKLSPANI